MRALFGFGIAFLFAGSLCAQFRGGATPFITGGFPSVVFPGGTPANSPGIVRFRANVVNPGGGGPQLHVPFSQGFRRNGRFNGINGAGGFGLNGAGGFPFPVIIGGFGGGYDYSGGGYADQPPVAPVQQPAAPAAPIIINIGVPTGPPMGGPPPSAYQAPPAQQQPQEDTSAAEPAHYLIAFKDHTIYSAVAYWVDGSTLHYFTNGNVHNQVSISLVDRELTERLNKETGMQVNLPK